MASELLWGAHAIGKAIGVSRRRAFHMLERGAIPARKIGGRWVASEERLREHFDVPAPKGVNGQSTSSATGHVEAAND